MGQQPSQIIVHQKIITIQYYKKIFCKYTIQIFKKQIFQPNN
jgi:hypothetical protein